METIRNFFFKAKPVQDDFALPQEEQQQTEDVVNQQNELQQQFYRLEQGSGGDTSAAYDEGGKLNDNNKSGEGSRVGGGIERDTIGSSARQVPDMQTQTQTDTVTQTISVMEPVPLPKSVEPEIEMPLLNSKVPKFREEQPILIDYNKEFVKFIDHHTPKGFSEKLEEMLPYLGASFISWPTYWLYRGIYWQQKRNTERIGLYIQRTFQHAKMLQLAILATGLLMATSEGRSSSGLFIHEVSNKESTSIDTDY